MAPSIAKGKPPDRPGRGKPLQMGQWEDAGVGDPAGARETRGGSAHEHYREGNGQTAPAAWAHLGRMSAMKGTAPARTSNSETM
jgi:hypothetical protein